MTVQTVSFGTEQYSSFSAGASGTDYTSNWNVTASVTTAEAPLTGSLSNTTGRPIRLVNCTIFLWANANPTSSLVQTQIATAAAGTGGTQGTSVTATGTGVGGTQNYEVDRAVGTVYYGFQKQDSGNVRFSTHDSTGNNIYEDGSSANGWPNRRLTGSILVHSVPSAPGTPTFTSATATTITMSWTAVSDAGTTVGVTGYRIVYKEESLPNGTNNANWKVAPLSSQASLGDSGSTTRSATVTGLKPGTAYGFMVAALNDVTDGWNTNYSLIASHTGTRSTQSSAMYTLSGIYDGTTWVAPTASVYNGTSWVNANAMVYNGTSWINWGYRP